MKNTLIGLAGFILGIIAYVTFFSLTTEKATVITEVAGTELLSGTFETPDVAHPSTGSFTIVATEGGMRAIKISDDFTIVHAPDPHVRVNGKVIAKVVNYEGSQVYPIPNFIAEDITSVAIWCEIADISLGNGNIMMMDNMEVEVTDMVSTTME